MPGVCFYSILIYCVLTSCEVKDHTKLWNMRGERFVKIIQFNPDTSLDEEVRSGEVSSRKSKTCISRSQDFPGGLDGKVSAFNVGDPGSILGSGRSPGGGNGNPLQYTCLEKSHGRRSLVGYNPWGSQKVRHDWAISLTHSLGPSPVLLPIYHLPSLK